MARNIGVNAILNVIKTSLSVLFPLITYPYISRVLGVENLGKVNYAVIFVSYFSTLAALGISAYAVREGSKLRENKESLIKLGSQLFSINLLSMFVAYFLLILITFTFIENSEYQKLILLQSLVILFTTLSIDWINVLYEDFLYITIRTIVIQICSLIALFVFVKTSGDIYYYIFLSVVASGLSCLLNFFYCRRYFRLRLTCQLDLKKHFRKIFTLFLGAILISIYVNSDVIFIEKFNGIYYVGIYVIAVKIYAVLRTIFSAIYYVAIPKLSNFSANNRFDDFKSLYTKLVSYLLLILLPVSTGIFILSKNIVLFMGGKDYIEAIPVLQIFSISIIGAILGGLLTSALNVSLGKESISLKGAIYAVLLNITLNIILVPNFMHIGAAISITFTEFFIFFYNYFVVSECREYIDKNTVYRNFYQSVLGCIAIGILAIYLNSLNLSPLLESTILVCSSVILYFGVLAMLRNTLFMEVKSIIIRKVSS
ncbi:oligosaccharide flippase family protein [Exercitatus varius]|uniref:Oligosaccharide flippase family protein n=1 Tax=Exercitatus varius TaxID=67857 RepID=A0AAW6QCB5_9PAST|nr:oligosaccharide flippase family protein [Exercitatus varius]MDG2949977.1 oligosaccharide flippase family protein [Exercitatus varius]